MSRPLLAALVALTLTACSGNTSDPRIERIAAATLMPGVGLGDLRLGVTRLGDFVSMYGTGDVSIIPGGKCALELTFGRGQLTCLFPVADQPGVDSKAFDYTHATTNLIGFLTVNPAYQGLALTSLSVTGLGSRDESFYRGRLPEDIGLFDMVLDGDLPRPERMKKGTFLPILAGLSPSLPEEQFVYASRGLVVYLERPSGGPSLAPPQVARMTIFQPVLP